MQCHGTLIELQRPGGESNEFRGPSPLLGTRRLAEVGLDCSCVCDPHGRWHASQLSGAQGWYGGANPNLAAGMQDESGAGEEVQVFRVGE